VFHKGGQRLKQNEAANVGGIRRGHRRKSGEACRFIGSMQTATPRIENEQNAPMLRERQTTDDRCRPVAAAATAVHYEAAVMKEADADTGTSSAPKLGGIAFDRERQTMQPPQAGRNRQRELSA
jgi:hypothetical protein